MQCPEKESFLDFPHIQICRPFETADNESLFSHLVLMLGRIYQSLCVYPFLTHGSLENG